MALRAGIRERTKCVFLRLQVLEAGAVQHRVQSFNLGR